MWGLVFMVDIVCDLLTNMICVACSDVVMISFQFEWRYEEDKKQSNENGVQTRKNLHKGEKDKLDKEQTNEVEVQKRDDLHQSEKEKYGKSKEDKSDSKKGQFSTEEDVDQKWGSQKGVKQKGESQKEDEVLNQKAS